MHCVPKPVSAIIESITMFTKKFHQLGSIPRNPRDRLYAVFVEPIVVNSSVASVR
jgi:hypothetical protein